jgi:hypothetical protein
MTMQIDTVFNDTSSPTNNAMRVSLNCWTNQSQLKG